MKHIQLLFIFCCLLILVDSGCKPHSVNVHNKIIDSVELKKEDSEVTLLKAIYNNYSKDFKIEKDTLHIQYEKTIQQKSPRIKAYFYLAEGAFYRSNKQNDSAVFYTKKSMDIVANDTAEFYKPIIVALSRLTLLYSEMHQNNEAIKYGYLCLNTSRKYNYRLNEAYTQLTHVYSNINDTVNLKKSILMSINDTNKSSKAPGYNNLGFVYIMEKKYDSASICFNKAVEIWSTNNDSLNLGIAYSNIALLYKNTNKFDSAMYFIKLANTINTKFENEAPEDYDLLGELYVRENNTANAIIAYKKMLAIAIRDSIETDIIAAYQKLAEQYMVANDFKNAAVIYDSGYSSLLKFKDNNFVDKINALETDYRVKNKQLEIDKINAEKNATIKTVKLQKYLLAAFGLLFLLGGLAVFQNNKRRKLKQEKDKINSEKELLELEQRLLRSQMNPHFIFNSIAGIRGNILNDEKDKAVFYLTKFSKLLRQILENSTQVCVTLTEELNTIENYIALQQMRYDNKFTYEIKIDKDINTDDIEIPSLLIQPFIENSIEHGFKGIDYQGKIDINIVRTDVKKIQITIIDNGRGIGNKVYNEVQDLKNRSISLDIIKMQLEIISKNSGVLSNYTINKNTENNGTNVVLQIGLK